MPELPEVETTRRGIQPYVEQQRIESVCVRHRGLRWPIPDSLEQTLVGLSIRDVQRRGKYLLLDCGSGWLLIHLGMSGSLRILTQAAPPKKHDHVDIVFDSGSILRFHDPRRFGALLWEPGNVWQHPLLRDLGPEPLDPALPPDYLYHATRNRRQAIKQAIMDSKLLVGVGNIYASEALFLAGIHPATSAANIDRQHCQRLLRAIQDTLRSAIEQGGSTLRDYVNSAGNSGYFQLRLQVYDRADQPCHACGTLIRQTRQGQRSTFHCPHCQHQAWDMGLSDSAGDKA